MGTVISLMTDLPKSQDYSNSASCYEQNTTKSKKKKKTRLAMLEHSFDFTVKDNCNSEKIDNK